MDAILRIFLPLYLVAYFAAAFFWRSYRVWKQTGVNPYVLGKSDNAPDFIGKIFRLSRNPIFLGMRLNLLDFFLKRFDKFVCLCYLDEK